MLRAPEMFSMFFLKRPFTQSEGGFKKNMLNIWGKNLHVFDLLNTFRKTTLDIVSYCPNSGEPFTEMY